MVLLYANKKKQIVQQAKQFCREHKINRYPVNIVNVCNELGIKVYEQYLPSKVSGFIGVDKSLEEKYQTDKVIVVNLFDDAKRRRFMIAHELAHYVLRRQSGELYAHRDVVDTPQRGIEKEANIFALNILMPEELMEEVLSRLCDKEGFVMSEEAVRYIADKFKVSKEEAKARLQNITKFHNC